MFFMFELSKLFGAEVEFDEVDLVLIKQFEELKGTSDTAFLIDTINNVLMRLRRTALNILDQSTFKSIFFVTHNGFSRLINMDYARLENTTLAAFSFSNFMASLTTDAQITELVSQSEESFY
jgi:hypothetical protein